MYVQESLEELCRCTTAPVVFFFCCCCLFLLFWMVLTPREIKAGTVYCLYVLRLSATFFFFLSHFTFFFFLLCGLPPCVFFFSFSSAPHSISPSSFLLLPFFFIALFFLVDASINRLFFLVPVCVSFCVFVCVCVGSPERNGDVGRGCGVQSVYPSPFPFFFCL